MFIWVEALLELGYRGLDGEGLVVVQLERAAGELGFVVDDCELGCCLGGGCLFNLLVSVLSTFERLVAREWSVCKTVTAHPF